MGCLSLTIFSFITSCGLCLCLRLGGSFTLFSSLLLQGFLLSLLLGLLLSLSYFLLVLFLGGLISFLGFFDLFLEILLCLNFLKLFGNLLLQLCLGSLWFCSLGRNHDQGSQTEYY